MKQFIVVGQDHGVAGPLADICDELEKRGGTCLRFLREPLPEDFASLLASSLAQKATVVICGMSSFEDRAANELKAAGIAIVSGAPLILFADIEPTLGRPHFEGIRPHAACFIVPNHQIAEAARLNYPNARFIVGNPDDEKNFRPKLSREESRRRAGVPAGTVLVVAPGGKDFGINYLHFGATEQGLAKLGRPFHLLISLHRDDPDPEESYRGLLETDLSVAITRGGTDELIPGADLVVASASGVAKQAGRLRIPVLNVFSRNALTRLAKSTGSDQWPEAIRGIEAEVRPQGDDELPTATVTAEAMRKLLDGELDLRPKQSEAYPEPEHGIAGRIAGQLLALL